MLERIRKVLLTDYIGAIVIAFLGADAFTSAIRLVLVPVSFWSGKHSQYRSVLGYPIGEAVSFPWDNLIQPAVTLGLYLGIVYLLVRWLYLPKPLPPEAETEESGTEAQP